MPRLLAACLGCTAYHCNIGSVGYDMEKDGGTACCNACRRLCASRLACRARRHCSLLAHACGSRTSLPHTAS